MDHALKMAITQGLVFSQAVFLALTASGLSRDAAYAIVQRNAMKTWADEGSFRELLGSDPELTAALSEERLDECFETDRFLRHVDEIYRRVFGE